MTTMAHASSPASDLAGAVKRQLNRIGPLGAIVLLHLGFFVALQSGLMRQDVPQAQPREVVASFITPDPAPQPPKPQPAAPKTVPIVKKTVTPPRPVPVVNTTPSPNAITAPQPEPAPVQAPAAAAPVAAAPAPAPVATGPKTITSGIEYLQAPQPDYPAVSKRMGEEGRAVVRVLVNEKGRPERAEVQKGSGFPRLDEAARQAVLRAVFKPFMEDGKAVPAYALVPIRFQLDN